MRQFKLNTIIFFFILIQITPAYSSKIDTLKVYSTSMGKYIKTIVIQPGTYKKGSKKNWLTAYVLHGYSGYPERTIKKDIPALPKLADKYNMFFIIPDGNYDSWYINSPLQDSSQYETFISNELVSYIDKKFKLNSNRKHRILMGWSMGGHGALYIGGKNTDIFGSLGSICGAVDFLPYGMQYGIPELMGTNKNEWKKYTVLGNVSNFVHSKQNIIISCGLDDEFLEQNRLLHSTLIKQKTRHTYIESPGAHTNNYWSKAAIIQIHWFTQALKN